MPDLSEPTLDHPTVLFLCVHNAGRSQMAIERRVRTLLDSLGVPSQPPSPGAAWPS